MLKQSHGTSLIQIIAPVNTQFVDILLSLDGGQTFPIVLAENVVNDGSHDVIIPGNATTTARIMIKANGNIFFAVNAEAFEIEESAVVLNLGQLEQEVCQGDDLVVPFIYETYNGFNEEATFSVVLPPSGVGIAFSPETATATDTPVNITFTDTQNLAVGSYPIRLLATTANLTKEIIFNLNVYDTGFTAITLIAPADGLIDTPTGILLEWEPDLLATSYDIEVATDAAFSDIVEAASAVGNLYMPVNLGHQTQYFWRVRPKNDCGAGNFGVPFSFATIQFNCENRVGKGLPLVISTTGTPTVFSEIIIPR